MILALALSPSLDVTYEIDRLRVGDVTRPFSVTRVAGGKALNAARVAHALGADVATIVALGGRTGAHVADLLAADGVDASVVTLVAETRTCFALVETQGGSSSTDVYEPATPLTQTEWSDFCDAALSAPRADWVFLSGSVPPGVAPRDVAGLLRRLADRGSRVAIDSSGPALHALSGEADLLKINRQEADELLSRTDGSAEASARAVHASLGIDVVITDGARGGWSIIGDRGVPIAAPSVIGRFSAGSGDAFLGGLLAALDRQVGAERALDCARTAAERNATCPGQGVLA